MSNMCENCSLKCIASDCECLCHSPESPNVEKLDEMPDYEPSNGVVDLEVPVSSPTISITNPSGQLSDNKLNKDKD